MRVVILDDYQPFFWEKGETCTDLLRLAWHMKRHAQTIIIAFLREWDAPRTTTTRNSTAIRLHLALKMSWTNDALAINPNKGNVFDRVEDLTWKLVKNGRKFQLLQFLSYISIIYLKRMHFSFRIWFQNRKSMVYFRKKFKKI